MLQGHRIFFSSAKTVSYLGRRFSRPYDDQRNLAMLDPWS